MSSSSCVHPDITTSRINRLLRPLRHKCAKIPLLPVLSTAKVSATYSSRRNIDSVALSTSCPDQYSEWPPLSVLPHPESIKLRPQLHKSYTETLELSRKLYAVRDCFRRIVQVAFGAEALLEGSARGGPRSRVLSLSAMCSIVVGQNIADYTEETDEFDMDNGESIEIINELHEWVPLHHRR